MSTSEIGKEILIEHILVLYMYDVFPSGRSVVWVGGRESLPVPNPHVDQKQLFSTGFCALLPDR